MLQRIQFTVKSYKALQGLVIAAYGLGLLLYTLFRVWFAQAWFARSAFSGNLDTFGFLIEIVVGIAILGLCMVFAKIYYRRTFGQVRTPRPDEPTGSHSVGWIAICMLLLIVSMALDVNLHLHISFMALAVAATLLIRWHCLGRRLHYYLVLAVLMVGASLLPFQPAVYQIFSQSKTDEFTYLLYAAVGSLLIVVGICDHVALVLSMRKVRSLMLLHSKLEQGE